MSAFVVPGRIPFCSGLRLISDQQRLFTVRLCNRSLPGYFTGDGCGTTTTATGAARLGRINFAGNLLAVELDAARRPNGLFVLPVVVGLHPVHGRAGLLALRRVLVDALAKKFRPTFHSVGAGVVAI